MEKYKGLREQFKDSVFNEVFTLEKLQEYLMEIYTKRSSKKDMVISKWCSHQNRIVQLSSNPSKCECSQCIAEMIDKYLKPV